MKAAESFICRLCKYQGERHDTEAAHIFERKEFEAIEDSYRKDYLHAKFGLDSVNHKSNHICLCKKCHLRFDRLNPLTLIWEINQEIFSEESQAKVPYGNLDGTKCVTKVALNFYALKHRYARTSIEVDLYALMSDLIEFRLVEKMEKAINL